MAAKSKNELRVQNQQDFPNNDTGSITPDKHRQFNEDVVDSSAVLQIANIEDSPHVLSALVDFVIARPGSNEVELPILDNYVDRNLFLVNISDGSVTVTPNQTDPETIGGESNLVIPDEGFVVLSPDADNDNWIVSLNSRGIFIDALADVDTTTVEPNVGDLLSWGVDNWVPRKAVENIVFTCAKTNNLANGGYLKLADVTMNDSTKAIIAPKDMVLKVVTIARSDSDDAVIEILKDGNVVATVATSATATVDDSLSVSFAKGDLISVRNDNTNIMSNVIVTLMFEASI